MLKYLLIILSAGMSICAHSMTFKDGARQLLDHPSVKRIETQGISALANGGMKGSLGDPIFKVAAKNYPRESLKKDVSPMTGIDFSISQKISISGKYSAIEQAFFIENNKIKKLSELKLQELYMLLWNLVIKKQSLETRIKISKRSLSWIDKQIQISSKLYSNGKIPQQGLLELNIRKSEIKSKIVELNFQVSEIEANEAYLIGDGNTIDLNSVPWEMTQSVSNASDLKENALLLDVDSKRKLLSAAKRDFISDINISLTYTKRENLDGNGDFVGAGVSFPLPLSGSRYSGMKKAVADVSQSELTLKDYQIQKISSTKSAQMKIKSLDSELSLLRQETIPFSKNSRDISSRSYVRGLVTYSDLLSAEIKLEELLNREAILEADLKSEHVKLKFIRGEKLYDN